MVFLVQCRIVKTNIYVPDSYNNGANLLHFADWIPSYYSRAGFFGIHIEVIADFFDLFCKINILKGFFYKFVISLVSFC